MRKVFLEDLPRWEDGTNKGRINWGESIGHKVKFIYDDVQGEVEIVDYHQKEQRLNIRYLDCELLSIKTGDFSKCSLGKLLKKKTNDFKIETGEVFKDKKRNLIIIGREYRKIKRGERIKWYKYACNKCGWTEGWINEYNLKSGRGCSCCAGTTVVLGINTIWDTHKWLVDDFGLDEEFAKTHTNGTDIKGRFICRDCGESKFVVIYSVISNMSIGCKLCSDGISYPEKFMINVLEQLNIRFITQLTKTTFEWCNDKRYDFYLPDYSCIIETHGLQHYKEANRFKNTLTETQENDKYKKELAINNGIEYYIELDCRKSDMEWIKNSTIDSDLKNISNLSNVNWLKCEEFALKNIVKEVCEYWNNKQEWETTSDLANHFNVSQTTIMNYLKSGERLRLCSYDVSVEKTKTAVKNGKANSRAVEVFGNNKSLGVFESASELERRSEELFGVKLNHSAISLVANGRYHSDLYKNYSFKHVN